MEPVVNGLEESYGARMDFRWLDANSSSGGEAFRHYQLVGHPSYVLVNPDGQVLWTGFGEQSGDALEEQIQIVLTEF